MLRLLDLFCGAGGAAMGYHRAGFEVVGVDINPQPHYPFAFVQMDAVQYLREFNRDAFDVIHASPPCQPYSPHVTSASSAWNDTKGKDEPALIAQVREYIVDIGRPYVIENVYGARSEMEWPVTVCGITLGRPIHRHRLFEGSMDLAGTGCDRSETAAAWAKARGWDARDMTVTGKGRRAGTSERWQEIMGIDWPMTQHELKEAIPPAYTEWIGTQLLAALKVSA